ncbi:DUF4202 family protein [Nanoarchaeota archaeon]
MGDFKQLVKEIEEIISHSPVEVDPIHSETTKKWLFKLKPWADIPLQIAALAHDIERGFQGKKIVEKFDNYDEYKKEHSEKSAKIIVDLMKKHDFDDYSIKKVERIVLAHEFGGDEDSDYIMDADSLSFFENNLEFYYKLNGPENTIKKIKFMYERMSDKAKGMVKEIQIKNSKIKKLVEEVIG